MFECQVTYLSLCYFLSHRDHGAGTFTEGILTVNLGRRQSKDDRFVIIQLKPVDIWIHGTSIINTISYNKGIGLLVDKLSGSAAGLSLLPVPESIIITGKSIDQIIGIPMEFQAPIHIDLRLRG